MKHLFSILPESAASPQISEPLLRLIRHSDPRDLADSPSLTMTVERFKRRFIQRLSNNLHIAESIIRDALVADGYSEPAALAEVHRFARQVAELVAEFETDSMSRAMSAEAVEQAQDGLDSVQPLLPGGLA